MRTLLLLSLALPAAAQDRIPALIVSGANNHDWEWTSPELGKILTESGRFDVSITFEPAKTLATEGVLENFDVIVLDYNGPRWGEAADAAFLRAVKGGTGVTIIHAANNAFPGWVEYETLVGDLWRQGTGHGRVHPFTVEVLRRDHPVTDTLPDLVAHPDELYHCLWRAPAANHETLACAHSSKESGGTGEKEPMVLVGSYGEGRIFHTPLGHVWRGVEQTKTSFLDPQFRNLVVRGTEWAATGRVTDGLERPNHLDAEEAAAGWRLIFDGASNEGWRARDGESFPESGWEIVNGCLRHTKAGGDIVSLETFEDFELAWEWKVTRGVNSGVKYRIPPEPGASVGPEYQILDDVANKTGGDSLQAAAALYAVHPARDKQLAHAGAFNHSRIVCQGNHLEHWLNGVQVLNAEVGSDAWNAAKAKSKFKQRDGFAVPAPGRILLQDHGGEVWFRSIRLRELGLAEPVSLLQGEGLEGWTVVGEAYYDREGDDVVGRVPEGGLARNSFLRTDRLYGDFVFDVELLVEVPGNSGIQFRSAQRENGRVYGYQAEIDPSKRSWSGGVYDEARRGWLDDLKDDPAGRAAFRVDDWNHYRIEAIGEHLRVWVNGVLTADLHDGESPEGFFALQVHGGKQGSFRWRNPRIREIAE